MAKMTSQPLKRRGKGCRSIPGHDGYLACEDGTILTLWRLRGAGYACKPSYHISTAPRPLSGDSRKEDGRKRYTLRRTDGGYRRKYGSNFVLEAFIGPRPNGMEACHSDGNCLNDSVDNLRWDMPLANKADMRRHGTQVSGETHPKAKIADRAIPVILSLRREGFTLGTIAIAFGVSPQRIHQICKKGSR